MNPIPDDTLRAILRRARRGDEAAARALLAACAPAMRLYARGILRDHALAEDAVQAALLSIFDAPVGRIDAVEDPRAWLLAVTRKQAAQFARARSRADARARRRARTAQPAPFNPTLDEPNALRDAIAALPRRWREAVILTDGCGLNLDRAAEAMRANRNTVAWWRRRAHAELRDQLAASDVPRELSTKEASHG